MFYCQSTLDRADHLRKDDLALEALRRQDNTLLAPVWNGNSLVADTGKGQPPGGLFLTSDHSVPDGQWVFLGLDEGRAFFAVDVSQLDEPQAQQLVAGAVNRQGESKRAAFLDLRLAGPTLNDQDGSLLAFARALTYWNQQTRHCIRCGHKLASSNSGHVRECTNTQCNYLAFPRTDPAVIMLVSHEPTDGSVPRCLLGRNKGWPDGVFSTLAGFVEPGETLEAAVEREVLEEASIKVTDAQYIASQPWPFPRSIMLGYQARALTTDIKCDPTELEDARWFTRDELVTFGEWGDDSRSFKLPRTDSISRFLIDRWIAAQ